MQVAGNAETRVFNLNFRKSLSLLSYIVLQGQGMKLALSQRGVKFLLLG